MAKRTISKGTAHELTDDLRKALESDKTALDKWESLTPLARNEWICWNVTPKKPETRKDHIKRTVTELSEGKRRPCCWAGCTHRTDKEASPSQKYVYNKQSKSK